MQPVLGDAKLLCLSSVVLAAVARHDDKVALICGEDVHTYRELDHLSEQLAAFLQARGVARGDRVALHLRNGLEYVVSDLALMKICAVKVPLNELMAPDELAYCLGHAEAGALISDASLPQASCLPPALHTTVAVNGLKSDRATVSWEDVISRAGGQRDARLPMPEDAALIAYTGGTTGKPKGVRHTQHRLAINLLATIVSGDVRSDEVMLLTTPLPHSAGYHLQACLVQGGTTVLATRFDPLAFMGLADRHQVTWTFAVPTMLYRLLDQIAEGIQKPSTLRTVLYGAAPMSKARLSEALDRFGPIFIQIYGQTECPNFITTLSKSDHLDESLLTSCGRPVPFVDLRISNVPTGEVNQGGVGEVEVSSPYLLVEYYKDKTSTDAALHAQWLSTGDLGYRDTRGYLFLVDRAKDMIISGGMNVYSVEVEAALRQHPAVADVAVLGVPDEDWGEAVIAVAIARSEVTEEELRSFARQTLSAYKIPKSIRFVRDLPVTKYGKIDKKALRQNTEAHRGKQ